MKPDARTKGWLVENGWVPWRVEVFNAWSHKKSDLFYICDYVALHAMHELRGVLGIQVTDASNRAAHRTDLLHDETKAPKLLLWLSCGNPFELHSWQKEGARGSRKLWTLSRERAILSPEGKVSFEEIK